MRKLRTVAVYSALLLFSALLVVGFAESSSLSPPVEATRVWMDPVTGSFKMQRRLLGFPSGSTVLRSAIELWLVRKEGRYANDWRFLNESGRTILGQRFCAVGRGSSLIYSLRAGESSDRFVRSATDREIAEFVRVMRTGTQEEQEAAVEAACKKAIGTGGL